MWQIWQMGLGISVASALAAFVVGWWLRGVRSDRSHGAAPRKSSDRRQLTERALSSLNSAAESVRSCVEEHIACIQAIETELHESSATDPAMLYNAADSIIAANGLVQHQFNDIQQLLDNRQVEMHDHLGDPYGLLSTYASLDRQKHVYRQVLGSLELLAVELMTNIAGHGQRLQKISNGLEEGGPGKLPDVNAAVTQIFDATDVLEQKMTSTEAEIGQHAEKVHMQAVLSHTDLLTALPNRRAFEAELEQCVARSRGKGAYSTVVFLDLDGFNHVNLQYGHQGGDVILRQTASVVKQIMRGKDLVTRYGGDTFAFVLSQTTLHDALPVADRIRSLIEQTQYSHGSYPLRLTASLGIAQLQPEEPAEEVVKRAEESLRMAKQSRGNVCYWHDGQMSYPVSSAFKADVARDEASQALVTKFRRSITGEEEEAAPEEADRSTEGRVLTGRSLFIANLQRRLAEWKRGGPPVSIVVLRVDQLESMVERFGISAATFLHGVMERMLEAATREMDERCEFENGQFAILLPGLDEANAVAVAERLQSQVRQCKVRMGDALWSITASIGVAPASVGTTVVDVVQSAERACRRAVEKGGDAICVGEPAVQGAGV
jgi:diguanylate cyclase (GGDEF)-like protein